MHAVTYCCGKQNGSEAKHNLHARLLFLRAEPRYAAWFIATSRAVEHDRAHAVDAWMTRRRHGA